jgi:hypothetical protein
MQLKNKDVDGIKADVLIEKTTPAVDPLPESAAVTPE